MSASSPHHNKTVAQMCSDVLRCAQMCRTEEACLILLLAVLLASDVNQREH